MANNYSITIKSPKLTQEVAADIFSFISLHNLVLNFNYNYQELKLYVRGYVDLRDILTKHNFDKSDFTEIMDEFDLAYRSGQIYDSEGNALPETDPIVVQYAQIAKEIECDVQKGKYTIWEYC